MAIKCGERPMHHIVENTTTPGIHYVHNLLSIISCMLCVLYVTLSIPRYVRFHSNPGFEILIRSHPLRVEAETLSPTTSGMLGNLTNLEENHYFLLPSVFRPYGSHDGDRSPGSVPSSEEEHHCLCCLSPT